MYEVRINRTLFTEYLAPVIKVYYAYVLRLNDENAVNLSTVWYAIYTVFQKSDAKIQITITTAYLIRIKYPLSGFNYHLSDVNIANFNKIHRTVSKQQLF